MKHLCSARRASTGRRSSVLARVCAATRQCASGPRSTNRTNYGNVAREQLRLIHSVCFSVRLIRPFLLLLLSAASLSALHLKYVQLNRLAKSVELSLQDFDAAGHTVQWKSRNVKAIKFSALSVRVCYPSLSPSFVPSGLFFALLTTTRSKASSHLSPSLLARRFN